MKARPAADLERDLLELARLHEEAEIRAAIADGESAAASARAARPLADLERRHAACARAYREACEREAHA